MFVWCYLGEIRPVFYDVLLILIMQRLSLEGMKKKICMYINQLEELGVVTRKDGYQFLVNSIVQVPTLLHCERKKSEPLELLQ